jgi:hypothetical protein
MFPAVEGKPDRLKPKFDGPPGRNFIAITLQARPDAPIHTQNMQTTRSADRSVELGEREAKTIYSGWENSFAQSSVTLHYIFTGSHASGKRAG